MYSSRSRVPRFNMFAEKIVYKSVCISLYIRVVRLWYGWFMVNRNRIMFVLVLCESMLKRS